jgi:hypothetical protein
MTMSKKQVILGAAIIAAGIAGRGAAASVWKEHGSKNGVTVFTAPVEGSDVPRVKGIVTIGATTDEVWSALISGKVKNKGLKQYKKLGKCGEGCEYVYHRLGHALIKDRHYIIKIETRVKENDGRRSYVRSWSKAVGMSLPGSGAMEVEKVSGSWTLTPVAGGGKTRLVYVNHMDLGGSVPAGLFATGFVESAYKILAKIRSAV